MTEPPIEFKSLARKVKALPPRSELRDASLTRTFFIAANDPSAEVQGVGRTRSAGKVEDAANTYRIDVDLGRAAIGQHSFPPGVEGTRLAARRKLLREDDNADLLTGYLPDHLARHVRPDKLDKQFRTAVKIDALAKQGHDYRWATTVFTPDDRYTFNDTAFPWCTTGRVETSSGGWASGTMVGPRHLLTCSHAIQWINPPNPFVAGWVKFTPSYFDGSEPFGSAWGTNIYWQQQVAGPGIDSTEGRNDYVVVVLDSPIGNLTGWMGSRTYDDGWDGGNYWSHIGYPGDLNSGTRPSFQGGISLNGDDNTGGSNQQIYHAGDVWPGQSGGPFFGWWSGEDWPRVVADQSWQNSTTNGASGGSNMVDLIVRARNEWP